VYADYLAMTATTIAADDNGNAYLGGLLNNPANNSYFPGIQTLTPPTGFQTTTTNVASIGPYLVKLNAAGMATYETYVGQGTGAGYGLGILGVSADANGVAYVGGQVDGPVTQKNGLDATSTYSGFGAFVAKIDTTKTGAASLLYSTYITNSVELTNTIYSVADNGAGQVSFVGEATSSTGFTAVNGLTQPAATNPQGSFVGTLDTTKTGDSALTFLSLIDGVEIPYFTAYDPCGSLVVGGFSTIGDVQDPFISLPNSYATSVGTQTNTPFFYKIAFAANASPCISLSVPTTLPFGDQGVNTTSSPQTITIKNTGPMPLAFSGVAASGPFAETTTCSTTTSLAAGDSCTISVTFTPTATGAANGTLTINDTDPSSPQTVALTGNGTAAAAPAVTFDPTSLSFAQQIAGTTSAAKTVKLTNSGNADLTITDITLTGANTADFTLDSSACVSPLAASASCNLLVAFAPTASGSFAASISVTDNAAMSPQTVGLTGTAASATETGNLWFNPAPVAIAAASAQTLTATFTLTGFSSAITPTATMHYGLAYKVGKVTCTGSAGNQTCSVPVTFIPNYPGGRKDALFLMNGTTRLATELAYGVGQSAFAMIQPGVVTTPILNASNYLYGSTVDENGTAYVVEQGGNTIVAVTSAGVVSTVPVTGLSSPRGVGIDGAGVLYIADQKPFSSITTYDTVRGVQGGIPYPSGVAYIQNITTGNMGNLYETDSTNVYTLAPNGTTTSTPITPQNIQASQLVVDDQEDVFIGGYDINEIPFGGTQLQINTIGAGDGIGVDAAETVYASRYSAFGSASVAELPATGYGTAEAELDPSANPLGHSVAPDGTVYVGNYNNLDKVDRTQGTINFGEQTAGTAATPTAVQIYNGGNEKLSLSNISISGEAFTIATSSSDNCDTTTGIAMGALCNLTVGFLPTHAGVYSGTVTITSNSLNNATTTQTVALSGFVYGVYVTETPTPLAFGSIVDGNTSAPLTVTFTNNGDLYAAGIAGFSSTDPAFVVTPSAAGCFSVGVGASCTATVTFAPTEAQAYSATISFSASSSGGGPNQNGSFTATGTGTAAAAPVASLSPTTLSFPNTTTGSTATAMSTTLSNTGNATLNISGITLSDTTDFAKTTTCGSTLAAGKTCTISVTFTPAAAQTYNATLSVADDASGSPQTVSLTGAGTGGVTVSPTSLNMGSETEYTENYTPQYITITNNTSAMVTFSNFASSDPAEFDSQDYSCPGEGEVEPGTSCQISVRFSPLHVGVINATITMPYTGSGGGTLVVSLSGTGTVGTPAVDLYPLPINFGQLPVATAATPITLQVEATGTAPLTGIGFSITGANASDYTETDTCSGVTIDPYPGTGSCNVTVNFTPTGGGPRIAALNVTSNSGAATFSTPLQGAGVAQPAQVQFTPTQLNLIAGAGGPCADATAGGNASAATLCNITGTAQDYLGNTYLVDNTYNVVYKVDTTGAISVFAGTPSQTGGYDGDDGPATSATLSGPTAVATDAFGDVFISDSANGAIREVDTTGMITSFLNGTCNDGGRGTPMNRSAAAKPGKAHPHYAVQLCQTVQPEGLVVDSFGNLFFADTLNNVIDEVGILSGSVSAVAGDADGLAGPAGYNGDGIKATTAELNGPQDVAVDPAGNLYIADTLNYRVRMVTAATGLISTIAGNGTQGDTGDGAAATSAEINAYGVSADLAGDLFITPGTGGIVRKVDATGNINVFAGNGTGAIGGPASTGAVANAYFARVDNAGDLLIPAGLQELEAGPDGLLQFGSEPIGSTSAALTATVENTGDSNLSITSTGTSITGADAADFAVTSSTCGTSLAPGKTCALSVTFKPSATGARTASVSVGSNAAGSPATVLLQGNGSTASAPAASLSPATLSFPSTAVGSTATAMSTTLSNTGNATLNISGITLTGANTADFAITTSATACGTTLAAGSTCTISVTFTPAAAASYTASISVADDATGSPQTATLSGTGTAAPVPVASLSPTTLTFPATTAGSTATAMSTTLSNTGNAVLNITGITLTGANAADFAITTSDTACGTSLAAGSTCTISATFTPATAGSFTASISVADNAANSPQTATLNGTGNAPPATDFTLTVTPPEKTVAPGAVAQFTVNTTGIGGDFDSAIQLTATGLPSGFTATFAPSSVTPGANGASSVLSIQTTSPFALAQPHPLHRGPWLPASLAALLVVPLLGLRKRFSKLSGIARTLSCLLLLAGSLAPVLMLTGCGGGYYSVQTQTYAVTVTGTSGSIQHSTTVTLTVQQ